MTTENLKLADKLEAELCYPLSAQEIELYKKYEASHIVASTAYNATMDYMNALNSKANDDEYIYFKDVSNV